MRLCNQCMEKLNEGNICPHCGYDESKSQDIPYALQPGTILNGKYLIGNVLGQGGFGITYIGLDLALDIKVAIKEYYVTSSASRVDGKTQQVYWMHKPDNMDHFIKEARRMAKLEKMPEIAHVRDVFYANNTAYIIMEYVNGQTLKQYLQKNGTMSWEHTIRLMLPVISALGRVHSEYIIHRDVTPDNLMMEPQGTLRVLDLGAAGDLSQNNGQASQMVAREGFSPYEQYLKNGKIGPWTDVYSVCATIYYCCTGKVIPDAYARVDQLINTHDGRIQMDAVIPRAGAEILQKGLALNAKDRIQNMQDLAVQLEASLAPGNTAPKAKMPPDQPVVVAPRESAVRTTPEKPKQAQYKELHKETAQEEPVKNIPDQLKKKTTPAKNGTPKNKVGLIIAAAALVLAVAIGVFGTSGRKTADGGGSQAADGAKHVGWQTIDGVQYYYGDDGTAQTGWQTIDGNRYYFGDDGAMQTGLVRIEGKQYYLENGVMRTGWQTIGGNKYYFESDGIAKTATCVIDGNSCLFDEDGVLRIKITKQPCDAYASWKERISTEVEAEGADLKYKWYVTSNGSEEFEASKLTSALYSTLMNWKVDGRKAYCRITDKYGNQLDTETATLRQSYDMDKMIRITRQPQPVVVKKDQEAVVKVEAEGEGLTYQWWYSRNNGDGNFRKSKVTSNEYRTTLEDESDDRYVLCVITDKNGNRRTTAMVELRIGAY